jgi:hypothetical protein
MQRKRVRQTKQERRLDIQNLPLFGQPEVWEVHLPSPEEIQRRSNGDKGFTKEVLASWGVSWPPARGWRERLEAQWREKHGP